MDAVTYQSLQFYVLPFLKVDRAANVRPNFRLRHGFLDLIVTVVGIETVMRRQIDILQTDVWVKFFS